MNICKNLPAPRRLTCLSRLSLALAASFACFTLLGGLLELFAACARNGVA